VRSPATGDSGPIPFGFTVALGPLTWRNRLTSADPGVSHHPDVLRPISTVFPPDLPFRLS